MAVLGHIVCVGLQQAHDLVYFGDFEHQIDMLLAKVHLLGIVVCEPVFLCLPPLMLLLGILVELECPMEVLERQLLGDLSILDALQVMQFRPD